METREELYLEHLQDMFGSDEIETYPSEKIEEIIDRILRFLPNKGKLYKYRLINGQAFENAFQSLKERYIWLANADTLNDDFDTTVNFNPEEVLSSAVNYLFAHPQELIKWIFNYSLKTGEIQWGRGEAEAELVGRVISCIDRETGKIIISKAKNLMLAEGYTSQQAEEYLCKLSSFLENLLSNKEIPEKIANNFLEINKRLRKNAYVFSLSALNNLDTMWAYYAQNNGFCIEYDFNRVNELSLEKKRLLISIYKVIYSDDKPIVSFLDSFKYFLSSYTDKESLYKSNQEILPQLITKGIQWKHEEEWRILLFNIENKLYADIVSAIYVDESTIEQQNFIRLKSLAQERNWKIFVRKKNIIGTEHIFEEYTED